MIDFVDSGHDLIIAADVQFSDLIREIAMECGAVILVRSFCLYIPLIILKASYEILGQQLPMPVFAAGSCGYGS